MQATTDTPDTDHGTEQSPTETLRQCDSAEEIKALNGELVTRNADAGSGHVERVEWEVITESADIVNIQSGDKLVRLDAQPTTDIIAVGDEVSESNGIHVLTDHERFEPQPIHLRLIQRWLSEGKILIVGTRRSEFTDTNTL